MFPVKMSEQLVLNYTVMVRLQNTANAGKYFEHDKNQ